MTVGLRLGCDIGGTFTDFVLIDDATGSLKLEKVLTTPDAPSEAIFNGLDRIHQDDGRSVSDLSSIAHGTTLVINALIERKGDRTALLTTEGFRDILEMRDELRYDVYDLQIDFPDPLVPRSLRFEVRERISADGSVVRAIDFDHLEAQADALAREKVESVAVCLLHSYASPEHERAVRDVLARKLPSVAITLSSDVLARVKEYERTSTTCANAYVKPKAKSYLSRIQAGLTERDFDGAFYVMQSSGGVIEAEQAAEYPIQILESGPAAGVAAAQWWGKLSSISDLICFDMGGTTAKLCAVADGVLPVTDQYEAARHKHFKKGSGVAINVPVLDLIEIGTGGGSIAHIDSLGLLKVGPRSAGAMPGPACYGRGGSEPTVTDANLVLGYIDANHFLGGSMRLDADASVRALAERLAKPLGLAVEEAAHGIHEVATESMAAAARLHLAEKGATASALTMCAYGGAGPLHAFGLASKLGVRKVIVPPAAGVMSALGMLVTNVSVDRTRTLKMALDGFDEEVVLTAFAELEREAKALLPESTGAPAVARFMGMRHSGQGYSVMIPLAGDEKPSPSVMREKFVAQYRKQFGIVYEDVPLEIVDIRIVSSLADQAGHQPRRLSRDDSSLSTAIRTERSVYCAGIGFSPAPVVNRYLLRPGQVVHGPAIIEERETSTFVGHGARAEVDEWGILTMEIGN